MSALCLFNVYNMAKHKSIFRVQGAVVLTTLKSLTCLPGRVQSEKLGKKSNKYPQSSEMATPVLPGWPSCWLLCSGSAAQQRGGAEKWGVTKYMVQSSPTRGIPPTAGAGGGLSPCAPLGGLSLHPFLRHISSPSESRF